MAKKKKNAVATKPHYKKESLKKKQLNHSGTEQTMNLATGFPLILDSICSHYFTIFFTLISLLS